MAKCKGPHKILLVKEWTAMGATVDCLNCDETFHLERPKIDTEYVGFEHTSQHGPAQDMVILVHEKELDK